MCMSHRAEMCIMIHINTQLVKESKKHSALNVHDLNRLQTDAIPTAMHFQTANFFKPGVMEKSQNKTEGTRQHRLLSIINLCGVVHVCMRLFTKLTV